MSFKSVVGIDAVDFTIQAIITAILAGWAAEVNRSQDAVVFVSMIGITSLVVLGIRRKLALKDRTSAGLSTGEMAAERIAELEGRMLELDAVQARVAELEDRLDFTERLLAQTTAEQRTLGRGEGAGHAG